MKKIVVLLSRNHGSNQQLLSIAKYLYRDFQLEEVHVSLFSHAPPLFPLYHRIIRLSKRLGSNHPVTKCLKRLVLRARPLSLTCSDIVLAKTGRYEFPAQLLAAGSGARTIYLGQPRRMNSKAFDCLVATPSTPADPATIFLETLPTSFTYEAFQKSSSARADKKLWVMLLGGNARGYTYTDQSWSALAQAMLDLAKAHQIRWRISSSPRTGCPAESLIKQIFAQNLGYLESFICWGDNQRKSVMDCLCHADMAFVTEDSASMLCEAVNSRLPTIAIRPDNADHNNLTTPLAVYHHQKGSLLRTTCGQLATIDLHHWRTTQFTALRQCWTTQWQHQENRALTHKIQGI